MSDIRAVFDQINDLEGTIAAIERKAGRDSDFAVELTLNSLRVRREEYLLLANELSTQQLVDVCDYRIIPDVGGNYPAKAVGGALSHFQDMFTAFFSSVRENRPRHRAIYDPDLVNASTMNVGYAYAGSLGLVLYVPNDQLLPDGSDQDRAIDAIFSLSHQTTADGVKSLAEQFGRAPVRRFYEWSKLHSEYGLSADIKWQRGEDVKREVLVQPQELRRVNELIEVSAEEREDTISLDGILVALDVTRHSFKLSFPDAKDVRGSFDDQFNWKIPHEIPGRYRAILKKKTSTQLWSEEEVISWTLLNLTEII